VLQQKSDMRREQRKCLTVTCVANVALDRAALDNRRRQTVAISALVRSQSAAELAATIIS
jgi:post-segregation antitoxin (ccd killing protein)